MNDLPITTLFMLESLDGKINSGNNDSLDVDRDWCNIDGVKEGLHQYYEIEGTTDYYSLNTGRVMAKIGINDRDNYPDKIDIEFIIIDNKPHLNENGLFLRNNLIDYVHIVIAPILVGGSDTSTLIDGKSITSPSELSKLKALKLEECNRLNDSYIELKYKVIK